MPPQYERGPLLNPMIFYYTVVYCYPLPQNEAKINTAPCISPYPSQSTLCLGISAEKPGENLVLRLVNFPPPIPLYPTPPARENILESLTVAKGGIGGSSWNSGGGGSMRPNGRGVQIRGRQWSMDREDS